MEFVSYVERRGIAQGKTEGFLEGLRTALRIRFGAASEAVIPLLMAIDQPDRLKELLAAAEQVESLDEFRARLSPPTNGAH